MATNARRQGHNFERAILNELRHLVPEKHKAKWLTARQGSREEDNKGNDIVNPLNIRFQCKKRISDKGRLDITPLLELKEEDYAMDILFIKATKKNKIKESPLGTYAVMDMNTFFLISEGKFGMFQTYLHTTKAQKANIKYKFAEAQVLEGHIIHTRVYHKAVVVLNFDFFLSLFKAYLSNYVYTTKSTK